MPRKHSATSQRSVGRFRLAAESDREARSLGVRLRRALLDEMPGMAAVAVRIEGANHEFQALPGVREDALAVIQAVRNIRIRASAETVRATLDSAGPEVKAGDVKLDSGQVVDPEVVIAHLSPAARLKLEVIFERGTGYRLSSTSPDGFLPITADFCPVRGVAVDAQADHLDITIETDGAVTPDEALCSAMEMIADTRRSEALPVEAPKPAPKVDLGPEFHQDPFGGAEPPPALDVVRESFQDFLTHGIPKLLGMLFPITCGKPVTSELDLSLSLVDYRLEMPSLTPDQCQAENASYQARLILKTRLSANSDQHVWSYDRPRLEEQEIDMGPIPLMTEQGDFVLGGHRRAVVMRDNGGHCIERVGDMLARELEALVSRMKPVLQDMLAATGGYRSDILRMVPISDTLIGLVTSTRWGQYLDETNPAASLTHKLRTSSIGFDRDDADESRMLDPRDFGRLSYLETPEGPNIGLIHSLCLYSRVDSEGNILTPYRKPHSAHPELVEGHPELVEGHPELVEGHPELVEGELVWLKADEEAQYKIADWSALEKTGGDDLVLVRDGNDICRVPASEVDLVSISPVQAVSPSSSMIPFLGHDNPTNALMGSNMMRQAVPLVCGEQPLVKSGTEAWAARGSGMLVTARRAGMVQEATSERIVVLADGKKDVYPLASFRRTNQASTANWTPSVEAGQSVSVGQVLADVSGTVGGEFALGRNVLVAYMPFRGWNFEDGICISDELVREEAFTSVFIQACDVEVGEADTWTSDGPNTYIKKTPYDIDGRSDIWTAPVGARVKRGDVLVQESGGKGRVLMIATPYDPSVVVSVRRNGNRVRVLLAEMRHPQPGDKFAGRHGNKGVVTKVLPRSQMPYMEDGTPVQMIINTMGVVSRLNLGQILETHYGMLAHTLGTQFVIPPFMTPSHDVLKAKLKEAGLPESGMFTLYDGSTGRPFESPVTVGYLHMMRLAHMVDDKMHAISIGVPSVVTRQPMGRGGQRLGSFEIWALEAYGAASTLQECLTIKSDDAEGRERALLALLAGENFEPAGEGRSLQSLEDALGGVCINVEEERR